MIAAKPPGFTRLNARYGVTRKPISKPYRKHKDNAKERKDAAFRREWEDIVLEGNPFEQMFTDKEVLEDVKAYTDWRPEIIDLYKRLSHEPPK